MTQISTGPRSLERALNVNEVKEPKKRGYIKNLNQAKSITVLCTLQQYM